MGENELLRYEPASPSDFIVPLNAIKLETYDTTSDGKWQVPKDIGEGSAVSGHNRDYMYIHAIDGAVLHSHGDEFKGV